MTTYRTNRSGFTLIEILIVVIILGILAAIVIPQFTNASTDARKSSASSQLQTLRSQIELYKLQHNETLPDLVTNWDQLTKKTNAAGSTTIATGDVAFGPYLQQIPSNPLNQKNTVVSGDGSAAPSAACGFIYDYGTNGSGSGHIWAGGSAGATYYNESTGLDTATPAN